MSFSCSWSTSCVPTREASDHPVRSRRRRNSYSSPRCASTPSLQRRRQQLPIDERLEGATERIASVDRSVEAGFTKLDGADKSHGARRGFVCKRKVGMLITLSDKRTKITTRKAILGDDLRPDVGVVANVLRHTGGLIASHIHP